MSADLRTALQKLASYKANPTRQSQDVYDQGVILLENDGLWKQGDEAWSFLEQMALASFDLGKVDVADRCIGLLVSKFPDSPRVDALRGIRMELIDGPEAALKYYDGLLEAEETNAAIWKRKITLLRRTNQTTKAIEELCAFLDTFYSDVEGWLELADIYSSCQKYTFALQSLQHALLLAPQNPFYALQTAETAYTAGDVPLALNMFLSAVELSDSDENPAEEAPKGVNLRAWYGVKSCTKTLLMTPASSKSDSKTAAPDSEQLQKLDELATERVLAAYSGGKCAEHVRSVVVKWLEGSV